MFLPQALGNKLKEVGFDFPCIGLYVEEGTRIITTGGPAMFKVGHPYYREHVAILYEQARLWLSDKRDIQITVFPQKDENGEVGYTWSMFELDESPLGDMFEDYYVCYNDAVETAIKIIEVSN